MNTNHKWEEFFRRFANRVSDELGSVRTFLVAVALILISGIVFGFSREWRDITGFIIVILTFLILFFLQKSENVSSKAIQLKLDELIKAEGGASNDIVFAEDKTEHELDKHKQDVVEESRANDDSTDDSGAKAR